MGMGRMESKETEKARVVKGEDGDIVSVRDVASSSAASTFGFSVVRSSTVFPDLYVK
jgi:hypothetical protein